LEGEGEGCAMSGVPFVVVGVTTRVGDGGNSASSSGLLSFPV
jgi:hypothetical protein